MLRSFREYLTQSMMFFDLCNTLKFVCGTHVHPCVRKRVCDAVSVFVSFLLTSCLLTRFTNDPSVKFTNGLSIETGRKPNCIEFAKYTVSDNLFNAVQTRWLDLWNDIVISWKCDCTNKIVWRATRKLRLHFPEFPQVKRQTHTSTPQIARAILVQYWFASGQPQFAPNQVWK